MGSWTSRQNAGVEEVDVASNHAYKYPPRSGNYFGSHFIMGGERFDTPQPEAYLFGENADLNFLGSRPTPFPYPPPQANEPTKTLKSLVNIRKESLRFVRAPPDCGKENNRNLRDIEAGKSALYNIEFTFDCDVRCAITIYYFCSEEITSNGVIFSPKDPSTSSETFHYKKGANQQFCQPLHVFDPTKYSDDELLYNSDKEVIPIAIHCVAEEGSEDPKQSHTTIAVVEKHTDGTYVLKALKQKLFLDGLCYLLQEIYGIENKNNENKNLCDDDMEDNGSECVICMCDTRDTLILPCRHLCLCNSCADSLRYQANNCPICRAPFRALLQIRALLKTHNVLPLPPSSPPDGSLENIPAGYEQIPLIEALNGPCQPRQPPSAPGELVETPEAETAIQAAEILNRSSLERTSSKNSPKDNGNRKAVHDKTTGASSTTPEFHMTVLMQREDNCKETPQSPLLAQSGGNKINGSQTNGQRSNKCTRPRDSLRLINEKAALEKDENQDEDSECEKLSPLLDNAQKQVPDTDMTALRVDATLDPIDTDTEHDDDTLKTTVVKDKEKQSSHKDNITPPPPLQREERADDSDYYTPEEPLPTALSPLYTVKERPNTAPPSGGPNSIETTPLRHPLGVSLPSTPLSHVSGRSSGDSYSSSSSTRHLLAVACSNEDKEKAVAI